MVNVNGFVSLFCCLAGVFLMNGTPAEGKYVYTVQACGENLPPTVQIICTAHKKLQKVAFNTMGCWIHGSRASALAYRGTQNRAEDGSACVYWNSRGSSGSQLPDENHNYCRAPTTDSTSKPWCYTKTTNDAPWWNYCSIPDCNERSNESAKRSIESAKLSKTLDDLRAAAADRQHPLAKRSICDNPNYMDTPGIVQECCCQACAISHVTKYYCNY